MANFKVTNETHLPIHVAISWGGIIQDHVNDLQPGKTFNFAVPGGGWHDMTGIVSNGSNQINPKKSNVAAFANWILGGVTLATTVVSLALIPFTFGATTPLATASLLTLTTSAAAATAVSAATAASITTAVVSAVAFTADMVITGINAALHPVSISNLYGHDGYKITFTGAEVVGTLNNGMDTFTVTSFTPLSLSWENSKTHKKGVKTAPTS